MARRENLEGQIFGLLKVKEFDHVGKAGHVYYKCEYKCGGEKIVSAANLKSGAVKSCGCLKRGRTKQNNGGVYYFQPNEIKLKGDYKTQGNKCGSKIKQYKLSPAELKKYLTELQTKEVQYRG